MLQNVAIQFTRQSDRPSVSQNQNECYYYFLNYLQIFARVQVILSNRVDTKHLFVASQSYFYLNYFTILEQVRKASAGREWRWRWE